MIVRKNIGPLKLNGMTYRFLVGRPVHPDVIKHWKATGDLENLKKSGVIDELVQQSKGGQQADSKPGFLGSDDSKERGGGSKP